MVDDQLDVFAQLAAFGELVEQLGTGELDCGQRGAKLMRGGGDNSAKVCQFLFAGEGELCCLKGLRHGIGIQCNATDVDAQKGYSDDNGGPSAEDEYLGNPQYIALVCAEWVKELAEDRGYQDSDQPEGDCASRGEHRGRDGDGPDN